MADIIDFLTTALQDKANKKLGKEFIELLKSQSTTAVILESWFIKNGFERVSFEECKKIISNKDSIIHSGDITIKENY